VASNFQIYSFKTRDSLHLKLTGDFDGSSAYELINTLTEHGKGFYLLTTLDTRNQGNVDINKPMFENIMHFYLTHILERNLKSVDFLHRLRQEAALFTPPEE